MKHFLENKITYNGTEVMDIFKRFNFIEKFKNNVKFYLDYDIMEGETPEIVSDKFYGTPDYWWLLCVFNQIHDAYYDWYMSQYQIEEWAKKLVPTYEDDYPTYYAKIQELITLNETHRKIRILKPRYIDIVEKNLKGWS